jgi:hypothetical protein
LAARRTRHEATDVFLNCPFDDEYREVFEAVVFAVFDCGFRPRCALEVDDSGEVRIDKLLRIIEQCRFGIHDLSRTELDPVSRLPRFNMPLELGLFLAAKRFGDARQKRKRSLILDRERYRYQKFISDIAGQDIRSHRNTPGEAIRAVRDWLDNHSERKTIPSGSILFSRYQLFRRAVPQLCTELRRDRSQLTYKDYCGIVSRWLVRPV